MIHSNGPWLDCRHEVKPRSPKAVPPELPNTKTASLAVKKLTVSSAA